LRSLILKILRFVLVIELLLAVWLTLVFVSRYEQPISDAIFNGLFHAVAAFNNAGMSLFSDNMMGFINDPFILLPIAVAVMIGGFGFPVIFELRDRWLKPRSWSILTRITVFMSAVLWIFPTVFYFAFENDNTATWGSQSSGAQWLNAFFISVVTRTAGFNAVDIGALDSESILLTNILMFIGGGSASTAGGVKITTMGVLAYVVLAEVLGRRDVVVGRRRISTSVQRQALSVFALGATIVIAATFVLLSLTPFSLEQVLIEVISAYSTVGLSMGITASLDTVAQLVIIALMYIGRLGPLVFATAIALSTRSDVVRVPEERIIIG
jgi:Trk-type K+ transport system membrane component